ncbi:CoF synthetase [uncultured Gelidibacter sp.]|uniref:CoF synthetase n=1 Tax=uncultured Gelidibacter sp. TaxID=259318 RepID=UPI002622C6B2|nr:CoF synthetase [uncultured Gelidibacter sp.]
MNKLLKHAVNTTSFYKEFADYECLEDFTVIDKNIIRDYYEDFKSSLHKNKNNYSAYTSGSTGTPFKLLHDNNKRDRNSADVIYFAKKAGFEIGHKLYYIRQWDEYNSPKPWISKIQNIYKHPVSKLSKPDLENLLQDMAKDKSSKGIMCYASVLDEMMSYLESTNNKPKIKNIKSVIAISESLKENVRISMENYFGIPVVSRYSNVENGILAQQNLGSRDFQINWASYFIEILDMHSNAPAKPDALGRIIVTDLYNYCMPMIRYDTGDVGQFSVTNNNGEQHITLKRVEGRKLDMISNTKGEMMSPFLVYHILKYPHIIQYQFIQENQNAYKIKLNVSSKFNSAQDIVTEFKQHLGSDADINLEYVNDIPLLSSGKRKFVINNYNETLEQAKV